MWGRRLVLFSTNWDTRIRASHSSFMCFLFPASAARLWSVCPHNCNAYWAQIVPIAPQEKSGANRLVFQFQWDLNLRPPGPEHRANSLTRHRLPSKFGPWNPSVGPHCWTPFFRQRVVLPPSRPDCLSLAANAVPHYLPKMFLFRYSFPELALRVVLPTQLNKLRHLLVNALNNSENVGEGWVS
jgi:hypothetical protein